MRSVIVSSVATSVKQHVANPTGAPVFTTASLDCRNLIECCLINALPGFTLPTKPQMYATTGLTCHWYCCDGIVGADDLEAEDEEEEEGWGFVQAPFLPPPPSQPDEVEHWARAMFTDGNAVGRASSSSTPQQQGYGLGLGIGLPRGLGTAVGQVPGALGPGRASGGAVVLGSSPSYGGMVPMERIKSLFGR